MFCYALEGCPAGRAGLWFQSGVGRQARSAYLGKLNIGGRLASTAETEYGGKETYQSVFELSVHRFFREAVAPSEARAMTTITSARGDSGTGEQSPTHPSSFTR